MCPGYRPGLCLLPFGCRGAWGGERDPLRRLGTFAFSVFNAGAAATAVLYNFWRSAVRHCISVCRRKWHGGFWRHPMGPCVAVALYAELLARVLENPIHLTCSTPLPSPCLPGSATLLRHAIPVVGSTESSQLLMLHKPYRSPRVWGLALCWWRCPSAYCARIENKNNAPYRDGTRARCIFYLLFNGGYHPQSIRKTARQTPAAPPPHTGGTNRQTAAHGKWQFLAPAPRSPLW